MFRTRDFILILTTVLFLLMSIGVTLWNQKIEMLSSVEVLKLTDVNDKEFTAQIPDTQTLSRSENISAMRKKIAESGDFLVTTQDIILDDEALISETENLDTISDGTRLIQCPRYEKFAGFWPNRGVQFDIVDEQRVVFIESISEQAISSATSSNILSQPYSQRKVLLSLPLVPSRIQNNFCINTDVIGIAKDGSLIRNNEASLYGVFGPETVIGYALDGFPIYGKSSAVSDECGGSVVNGFYQYSLSENRDEMLNCFMAKPISL